MCMQVAGHGRNYRLVLIPSPILKDKGKQIYIRWAIFHTHYCCMQNLTGSNIAVGEKPLGGCKKRSVQRESVSRVGFNEGQERKQSERQGLESLRSARVIWMIY